MLKTGDRSGRHMGSEVGTGSQWRMPHRNSYRGRNLGHRPAEVSRRGDFG
jgi:hypothetical protein